MEVIDLVTEPSPVPYASDLAPREAHGTRSNPSHDQKVKPFRMPKHMPQFSYRSGKIADLAFLHKKDSTIKAGKSGLSDPFDSVDSAEEDFPSPAALLRREGFGHDTPPDVSGLYQETGHNILHPDESLVSVENDMVEFDDSMAGRLPTPKADLNFEDHVFDFAAFDERRLPSPTMTEGTKRDRSCSPDVLEVKHRRVSGGEAVQIQQQSVPAWVDEFDPEFIDGLKDIVEFVD